MPTVRFVIAGAKETSNSVGVVPLVTLVTNQAGILFVSVQLAGALCSLRNPMNSACRFVFTCPWTVLNTMWRDAVTKVGVTGLSRVTTSRRNKSQSGKPPGEPPT